MNHIKQIEVMRKVLTKCIEKFNLCNNPVIDDKLLLYEGTPDRVSKELAAIIMTYKKEATIEDFKKLSSQSASLIRNLRNRGFIFKDSGNKNKPKYYYINTKGETCRQIIDFKLPVRKKVAIKAYTKQILEKSVAASVSAIEIYNKPDFKYREETFSILMINALELLLKARILMDNNDKLDSIYAIKDGVPKKNRTGNNLTIDVHRAIEILKTKGLLDEFCQNNIEALIEIRDNSIHFMNKDVNFNKKIQEYGIASLKNYITLIDRWFHYDLSKYNFYLMPLSFFHTTDIESFSIKPYNEQMQNLINYLNEIATKYPSNGDNLYNVTLNIKTKFVKAQSDCLVGVRYTNDPNAPAITVLEDDIIKRKYPLDYLTLEQKLRGRYLDFKPNKKFYDIKKSLEDNSEFCRIRYLDVINKRYRKKYYSTEIIKEFDKYYKKLL